MTDSWTPADEARERFFKTWLGWIAISVVGFTIVQLWPMAFTQRLWRFLDPDGPFSLGPVQQVAFTIALFIVDGILGVLQGLFLRRRLRRWRRWLVLSAVGYLFAYVCPSLLLLGTVATMGLLDVATFPSGLVGVILTVGGVPLGWLIGPTLIQWRLLRLVMSRPSLWIGANLIALAFVFGGVFLPFITGTMPARAVRGPTIPEMIAGAVMSGAVYGILTGYLLARFLKPLPDQQPTNPETTILPATQPS